MTLWVRAETVAETVFATGWTALVRLLPTTSKRRNEKAKSTTLPEELMPGRPSQAAALDALLDWLTVELAKVAAEAAPEAAN